VAHVSTVNDDIMGRTAEVQSAVGTTPLGSTIREAREVITLWTGSTECGCKSNRLFLLKL
jgi:hypothetical protein